MKIYGIRQKSTNVILRLCQSYYYEEEAEIPDYYLSNSDSDDTLWFTQYKAFAENVINQAEPGKEHYCGMEMPAAPFNKKDLELVEIEIP